MKENGQQTQQSKVEPPKFSLNELSDIIELCFYDFLTLELSSDQIMMVLRSVHRKKHPQII